MFTTTIVSVNANDSLTRILREVVAATEGCRFEAADSAAGVRSMLRQGGVGLLVFSLAGGGGEPELVALLQSIRASGVRTPVLVVRGADDPELRLRLLRLGVADCLPPPLDISRLAFLVDFLTLRARLDPAEAVERRPDACLESGDCVGDFLFATPVMRRLLEQLRSVARLDTTLLITGETGTGKSHLASVVHELSPRRNRPFAVVHCGALSSTLIRSELFGHVRGAFTGADCDRTGRFAEAQDGTILVDEVDCVPLDVQANLLRAVEDRMFEPVGSCRSQALRARLVVTSNRPLEEEVAAGRFRDDLYYRLNVVSVGLPPLRECPSIIGRLLHKFLAHYCRGAGRPPLQPSEQALHAMECYDWPGNVRELRNVAERSAALCPGPVIELTDLPERLQRLGPASGPPLAQADRTSGGQLAAARDDYEYRILSDVLRRHDNNRTVAATELGISRVTLYRKLRRHGLV